ncbi:MAG: aminoacyl-tRNA hydrolase, partial [Candidatus Xenobia bacterium]
MRLVVGLGNPGSEYAQTRHNAGFMVVDRLAREFRADSFRREARHEAEIASCMLPGCGKVWLCKPQTFMNESGRSVSSLANFYQIPPEEVLVVADDFALPLGKLRLRERGSSGGHNGLESVGEQLGTNNWPRLRIGIGPLPPRWSWPDFVLARFAPD